MREADLAATRVSAWAQADGPPEVPGQVGLVVEAGCGGYFGRGRAGKQHFAGEVNPPPGQVLVGGDAVLPGEAADEVGGRARP